MKPMRALLLLFVTVIVGQVCAAERQSTSAPKGHTKMKASHVHLGVKDLAAALQWLDKVWQLRPTFQNERMASVPFGDLAIILDASPSDTSATVGFDSQDCDEDFRAVRARGGVPLEEPRDRPWGVRSAYVQGPGALRFEIEQALPRR